MACVRQCQSLPRRAPGQLLSECSSKLMCVVNELEVAELCLWHAERCWCDKWRRIGNYCPLSWLE
eukprot:3980126-Amphidinium_carterae.1